MNPLFAHAQKHSHHSAHGHHAGKKMNIDALVHCMDLDKNKTKFSILKTKTKHASVLFI